MTSKASTLHDALTRRYGKIYAVASAGERSIGRLSDSAQVDDYWTTAARRYG